MYEIFITDELFEDRAMGFEVSFINSNNSIVKGFKVSAINVYGTTFHMVRAGSTTNGGIKLKTTITGRNGYRHVNAFTNGNKDIVYQVEKIY